MTFWADRSLIIYGVRTIRVYELIQDLPYMSGILDGSWRDLSCHLFWKEGILGPFSSLRERCYYPMKPGILWKSQVQWLGRALSGLQVWGNRYIESNVPISFKNIESQFAHFLLCEILHSVHKSIYFVWKQNKVVPVFCVYNRLGTLLFWSVIVQLI